MNQQRLLELAERRGELTAHIAMQRMAIAGHSRPVERVLGRADQAVRGISWLNRHPQIVLAFVAGIVIVRPRRAWRWAKRGFFVWRGWKALRAQLD